MNRAQNCVSIIVIQYVIFYLSISSTGTRHESTKLENSTYNILVALGKEADFLYSSMDKYIEDAQSGGRQHLVELWNDIKQDEQRHLSKLRECLEKEVKEEKLSGQ